jgi:DNA-binding transcriptional MerR regulator
MAAWGDLPEAVPRAAAGHGRSPLADFHTQYLKPWSHSMVNTGVRTKRKLGMRIGELAKRAAIAVVDTVRYYEKAGLLPLPPRRPNGYREYGGGHLQRLAFIRHCRALDMPLNDVRRLLDLLDAPGAECRTADCLIDEQLAQMRERIADLRTLEQ